MKNTNKKDLTNFYEKLYNAYPDEDAYIEVVIDYTKSKYFKADSLMHPEKGAFEDTTFYEIYGPLYWPPMNLFTRY